MSIYHVLHSCAPVKAKLPLYLIYQNSIPAPGPGVKGENRLKEQKISHPIGFP